MTKFALFGLLLLTLFIGGQGAAFAQAHGDTIQSSTIFPDEFSDLDRGTAGGAVHNASPSVNDQLNKARQKYLMALSAIERGDTVLAAKRFESSILILNSLADKEGIHDNSDFTELVQVAIEDYETYVTDIDLLDTESSFFILRERVFAEVDARSADINGREVSNYAGTFKTTIPLPVNESVEKNIQFFTHNKGRSFMNKVLERSGKWFPTLYRIAAEEDMPPEIIYIAMFESGLHETIVSPADAVGMWQFIKSTGKMYDLKYDTWVDERQDVEKATRAAMHFLKDLYDDLGSWHLAMAAYNCGPGGVRRAQRRARKPGGDFWEICDKLPRETRNYVPRFIATTMITMNPEKYGFNMDSLNLQAPYKYDSYALSEPVNLSALARCVGISLDSIKKLNPELRKESTPPNCVYKLKIPSGSKNLFTKRFAALDANEKQPFIRHTVESRETLGSIANAYGVTAADLAAVNDISGYKKRVRRGQTLKVPITAELRSSLVYAGPPTREQASRGMKSVATVPSTKLKHEEVHIVRRGESLGRIANRYGVSVSDLRNWNNITSSRGTISIGDRLTVNVTDQPESNTKSQTVKVNKVASHKVARGETLGQIATKYGTSINRLRQLNGMSSRSVLQAGATLKVETTGTKSRSTASRGSVPTSYKVRRGDTLSSISSKFGVSIRDLRKANPALKNSDIVRIGQRLSLQ